MARLFVCALAALAAVAAATEGVRLSDAPPSLESFRAGRQPWAGTIAEAESRKRQTLSLPTSCNGWRKLINDYNDENPNAPYPLVDGSFKILVGQSSSAALVVYCADMARAFGGPYEYLDLPAGAAANFAEAAVDDGDGGRRRLRQGCTKLRIDPVYGLIDIGDLAFCAAFTRENTVSDGSVPLPGSSHANVAQIAFGTALTCTARPLTYLAEMRIDLTGTGVRLATVQDVGGSGETWTVVGNRGNITGSIPSTGKTAQVSVSGWCAHTSPVTGTSSHESSTPSGFNTIRDPTNPQRGWYLISLGLDLAEIATMNGVPPAPTSPTTPTAPTAPTTPPVPTPSPVNSVSPPPIVLPPANE